MKKGTKVTLFAAAVTGAALAGARLARLIRLQNEELNDLINQEPGYRPEPQAPAEEPAPQSPGEAAEEQDEHRAEEAAPAAEQEEEETQEEEDDDLDESL